MIAELTTALTPTSNSACRAPLLAGYAKRYPVFEGCYPVILDFNQKV